jgi:xanthine dehydrogenase accessory factor
LKSEGIEPTKDQAGRIFAPVGLDIGAETPSEIGLSILSEIQAVLTESDASHLREIEGAIHKNQNNTFKTVRL